jgi:hypothetical protein
VRYRVSLVGPPPSGFISLALFGAWLAGAVWLSLHHVFWRDEVRALSIATQGDTVADMLRALHGEGHPALWYLLLRAGDALIGRVALPVIALAVAAAAAALLIWRSPFSPPVKIALLLTKMMIFEYVVVARNYGVSLLLMLGFAALYARHRSHGGALGIVLFMLANTNIHSTLIALALMGFWAFDIVREDGARWTGATRTVLANAVLVGFGALICAVTVFPSFNDAGALHPELVGALIQAAFDPGAAFSDLGAGGESHVVLSLLLYGVLLGLLPDVGLVLTGWGTLVGLSMLFALVKPSYRHEALWLSLIVTLYWIAATRRTGVAPRFAVARLVGQIAFAALLVTQIGVGLDMLHRVFSYPYSRSRDLGALLSSTPELASAVVIADPDYLIEALPYYAPNPVYRLREEQDGPIVRFTKKAKLELSLGDVLDAAKRLRAERRSAVVILLSHDLDGAGDGVRESEGYDWVFTATRDQIDAFRESARLIASFGPAVTDETYSVYLLPLSK